MNTLYKSYKTNCNVKLYVDFIVIFFFLQFLFGFIFFQNINFQSEKSSDLWFFFRRFFLLTFFIYSFWKIYKDAEMVTKHLFKNVNRFLIWYFIASFFITCIYKGTPYTVFSYLGNLTYNLLLNKLNCDSLCLTFNILLNGNVYD